MTCHLNIKDCNCTNGRYSKQGLCDFPYLHGMDAAENSEVTRIIREVTENFGVSYEDITSRKRDGRTVKARHHLEYLLARQTDLRLVDIGEICGGRTPGAVQHGYMKVAKQLSKV